MDANLEEKKDIHKQIVSEVRFSFFDLSPDGLHSSSLGVGIQVGILNVVKDAGFAFESNLCNEKIGLK